MEVSAPGVAVNFFFDCSILGLTRKLFSIDTLNQPQCQINNCHFRALGRCVGHFFFSS